MHRARAHLKVLVWNALLTKKLPMFFFKEHVPSGLSYLACFTSVNLP